MIFADHKARITESGMPADDILTVMINNHGIVKAQNEVPQPVFELKLDHQLHSPHVIDFDHDGNQELVVAGWDGTTFIIDQFGRFLRFNFEDRVRAFHVGEYTLVTTI